MFWSQSESYELLYQYNIYKSLIINTNSIYHQLYIHKG